MSSFLVFSRTHLLLPFAWRLMREGHEVTVVIGKDRYEKCWSGKLRPAMVGRQKAKLDTLVDATTEAGAHVVTDATNCMDAFRGYDKLWGFLEEENAQPLPPVCLGGWFTGEDWECRHLLMDEMGLWPNGLGPKVLGGTTLVRANEWSPMGDSVLERVGTELKARDFKGLVKIGVEFNTADPHGEMKIVGFKAGWPFLQTHAFVAGQQGDFGATFDGDVPVIDNRFTIVTPLSVAPWPLGGVHADKPCNVSSEVQPIPSPLVNSGGVFFSDMRVQNEQAVVAGTDGLVGVLRGGAQTLDLARLRIGQLAQAATQLPGAQVRNDVGTKVGMVLAVLEQYNIPI